ncbi:MAG TPA: hypothetical protein VFA45_21365 [Actinomycetes bacterium]|nr:hypothetical protein [Actinomycetes bacterium]
MGGMPHADPRACVDAAVSACPDLPFWPTRPLAVTAEEMVRQWSSGLPGVGEHELPARAAGATVTGDKAASSAGTRPVWVGRDRAPGRPGLPAEAVGTLEPFIRALRRRPDGWLKLQAAGPVTLALALQAGGREALAVPSARGPLAIGYAARIRSLVTRVREALPGWRVVLVLDEPSLGHPLVAAQPQLALELWRTLGSTGADVTGLHCCATPPWGLVLDLDPQLVSFDAIRDGDAAADDPAFRRLVEGGAAVAWGLLPGGADRAGGAGDPDAIAERLLDLVEWTAGDYLPEVLARSLVTPTCGLAALSEAEAARRLSLAASVGSRAWSVAGLP